MISVGRLSLNESVFRTLEESPTDRSARGITLKGKQVGTDIPALRALHADVINSQSLLVPVTFTRQSDWNGYYVVSATDASMTDWSDEGSAGFEWSLELDRVGGQNDTDIQSLLSGPVTLPNDFTATGERWHAAPGGHAAYYSGTAQPGEVTRTGADGAIIVYRNLGYGVSPRYNVPVANYGLGRVRFRDALGIERTGTNFITDNDTWTLDNSLVRVRCEGQQFWVGYWTGAAWDEQAWVVERNAAALGVPVSSVLLRNDYECVIVRSLYNMAFGAGRITVDYTLRRGALFVELMVRSMLVSNLGIRQAVGESTSTLTSGYRLEDTANAAGLRRIIGSAKTFTSSNTYTGLEKTGTLTVDAMVGYQPGGASPVAGNTAAQLYAQYLGAPSERVIGVRL